MKVFLSILAGIVITILLIIVIGSVRECGGDGNKVESMSVAQYSKIIEDRLNEELSDPLCIVRSQIKNIHGTVKVTSAHVSDIRVKTKDGSYNAGVEGNNVREVEVKIMTRWDGVFNSGGYTEFRIKYDITGTRPPVVSAGVVRTNAIVNLECPEFWAAVATLLLPLLEI